MQWRSRSIGTKHGSEQGADKPSRSKHVEQLPQGSQDEDERTTEIVALKRLRLINNVPVMVQQCWLPHARCPGLLTTDLEHHPLYAVLHEHYGLRLARSEMVIGVRLATDEEQAWLAAVEQQIVLMVDQRTFTQNQRPIELSCSVIHPQHYPLNIEQGRDGEC